VDFENNQKIDEKKCFDKKIKPKTKVWFSGFEFSRIAGFEFYGFTGMERISSSGTQKSENKKS
jgi:hypothetical protein